ncbi:MAG: long-chain-fatty-acid--CoA ligase-related protein [Myxococcaceae bacterium]|nr:long-chain-fatty-acid--CoA ligase-related protein [Myxococcaceae bacterium]
MTYAAQPSFRELTPAEGPSADSLAPLLAGQLALRGNAVAVLFKACGLYCTETWRGLSRAVHAAKSSDSAQPSSFRWLIEALAEAALGEQAQSTHVAPLSLCDDDLLWLEPSLNQAARAQLLRAWLGSASRLGLGESADTTDADRRELTPTVVVADASWYEALVEGVLARAAGASRARRALIDWALDVSSPGRPRGPKRALAKLLVLRPLRHQLGLSRVRLLLVSGQLRGNARAVLESLDLTLRALEPGADTSSAHRASMSASADACLVGSTELST